MMQQITVKYFAWLRERIGIPEETITLPKSDMTVADLVTHLAAQGDHYEYAFQDRENVRVALDQVHADPADAIGTTREVALFPPMTGG